MIIPRVPWRTALALGRVSNLPTVWTNALAGAVLGSAAAGGAPIPALSVLLAALSLSLLYVGGMWLNDAFDAEIDAAERKGRPIPAGEVDRRAVFYGGVWFLIGGAALAALIGDAAALVGVALAAAIVLYDSVHKRTALAPVLMGLTRLLAYALGAVAVGSFSGPALWGALGLFAWVVGLTYAARQEAYDRVDSAWPLAVLALPVLGTLWAGFGSAVALLLWLLLTAWAAWSLRLLFRRGPGDVPRGVISLIAGIALYDAVVIAAAGAPLLALLAVAGFAATLAMQRLDSGT